MTRTKYCGLNYKIKTIMRYAVLYRFFALLPVLITVNAFAQNPLIRNQFTADPSARVFGDRVYIYPSHDIPCTEGKGRVGWFCMEDYHVFSSANLTDWTDHGAIITQSSMG